MLPTASKGLSVFEADLALPRGVWRFFLAIAVIAVPLRHCCRLDGDAKLLGSGSAPLESDLGPIRLLSRGAK